MNQFKKIAFIVLTVVLVLSSCKEKPNYNVPLEKGSDSVFYYVGYGYAKQMKQQAAMSGIEDFNVGALASGMQAAAENKEIPDQEISEFMNKYFEKLQKEMSQKALHEGLDFLESNKKKEGVITMPSGIQYRVVRQGNGIKPTSEDEVDVVYHGTLVDGTVFDSSKDRKDTATFNVNQVVPGFKEALTLMPEGSIWEVVIPSELGYGEHGTRNIKPNSVIIFEIDLVKVKKK